MRRYNKVFNTLNITSQHLLDKEIRVTKRYNLGTLTDTIVYAQKSKLSEKLFTSMATYKIDKLRALYLEDIVSSKQIIDNQGLKDLYTELFSIQKDTEVYDINYHLSILHGDSLDERIDDYVENMPNNIKIKSFMFRTVNKDNLSIEIDKVISALSNFGLEHLIVIIPVESYLSGVLMNFKTYYTDKKVTFIVNNFGSSLKDNGLVYSFYQNNKPCLTPTDKTWSKHNLVANELFYSENDYTYVREINGNHNNIITIVQYIAQKINKDTQYNRFLLQEFCNEYIDRLRHISKEKKRWHKEK